MMQAANIPLGHLYSSGPQVQHQYSPEEEELVNMLVNRDQYLQDQQSVQIGQLMATVRQPDVIQPLQLKALNRINQFRDELKGLYLTQRSKKKLSAENMLRAQELKNKLDFDLSTMKQITDDFRKEHDNIGNYAVAGYIDPQAEQKLYADWLNKVRDPNLGLADIPLYSAEVATVVHPKMVAKKQEDEIKKAIENRNLVDKIIAAGNQGQDNQYGEFDEQKAMRMIEAAPASEVDFMGGKDRYLQQLRDSWIRRQVTQRPGATFNYYGGSDKFKVPEMKNEDGSRTWVFTDKPINYTKGAIKGNVVAVLKGSDGKWYGELAVPQLDQTTENTILNLWGQPTLDRFRNGINTFPLDAADYAALKRNNLDLLDLSPQDVKELEGQKQRTSKDGTEQKPKQQHPKGFIKEISESEIVPASLVKGGVYLVNGVYRQWNGSKLVKIQ